jgi:hypothetical protein
LEKPCSLIHAICQVTPSVGDAGAFPFTTIRIRSQVLNEVIMNNQYNAEWQKLHDEAKWIIRQLVFELESRNVCIELYDAEPDGFVIYFRLVSGQEEKIAEYAEKLSILKQGQRLEVQHAKNKN